MVSTFCILKDHENVLLCFLPKHLLEFYSNKFYLSLTFKCEIHSELSLLYDMR